MEIDVMTQPLLCQKDLTLPATLLSSTMFRESGYLEFQ